MATLGTTLSRHLWQEAQSQPALAGPLSMLLTVWRAYF